jgi:hypothetical protein
MPTSANRRWLVVNFAATIFVSAFLLFQIQPLVSKYILPWFGGTPAVWTTCILFFQTLLFGGYAYAHFSATWLKPRQQAVVHLVLILAALLLLRVIPGDSWKPTDSYHPGWKILVLLTATVGLPYFVLSSTGPLIQAWFARSFEGRAPYRLYALSNVGSLLALLSYPFFFERLLTVHTQANVWAAGFIVYAALCGYAAMSLWASFRSEESVEGAGLRVQHSPGTSSPRATKLQPPPLPQRPEWWRWPVWLLLPALASMTLLATTNHVCADMTPAPFLWVVPLALYLLTFIIAFDQPKLFVPVVWAIPVAMAIYAITMIDRRHAGSPTSLYDWGKLGLSMRWIIEGLIHHKHGDEFKFATSPQVVVSFAWYVTFCFATMFGICMLCHGELFRLRPQPHYLTGYYLMIAAGGALGGLLVAIVAPLVFVTYVEWSASVFLGFLLAAGIVLRSIWGVISDKRIVAAPNNLFWTVPAFVVPLALLLIGIFDLTVYLEKTDEGIVLRQRNFFGALHIEDNEPHSSDQHNLSLVHGRITHGMQYTDEERRHIPTTYYARDSGVGRAVGFYRQVLRDRGVRIGCIGLGTGTMAAYVDRGDSIRFYDINPAVIEISTSGKWFTYFTDAKERGGKSDVVLGDARLSLERERVEGQLQHFDVLVLDAFSGDAIPVHLLTKEAFKIYLDHLASAKEDGQDGAIAVHITNRYLDLEPVVLGLAEEFKLGHVFINNAGDSEGGYNSDWIILTHNAELLKELEQYAEAEPEERDPKEKPKKPLLWTDDFSNLFDVLK